MKRMLTFFAMIAGAFTLMMGTSSCKDKEECCEWTYDTETYRACEDDAAIQNYSWDYIKAQASYHGGSCD